MSIPFTWVYLIYDPYTGLYKIGKSDTPDKRCETLGKQAPTILAAPAEYQIYEAWLCPESIEKIMHDRFESKRVRGEWFELNWQDIYSISDSLSWYRRWTVNVPKCSSDLEFEQKRRGWNWHLIQSLHRKIKSLKEQRLYLVRQRDAALIFYEPSTDHHSDISVIPTETEKMV